MLQHWVTHSSGVPTQYTHTPWPASELDLVGHAMVPLPCHSPVHVGMHHAYLPPPLPTSCHIPPPPPCMLPTSMPFCLSLSHIHTYICTHPSHCHGATTRAFGAAHTLPVNTAPPSIRLLRLPVAVAAAPPSTTPPILRALLRFSQARTTATAFVCARQQTFALSARLPTPHTHAIAHATTPAAR